MFQISFLIQLKFFYFQKVIIFMENLQISDSIIAAQSGSIEIYQIAFIILFGTIFVFLLKKYMAGAIFDTSKYNLKDKYAVVTGGNSGIGKQTVLQLVRLNCNIIIGARDKRKSQQVIKQALEIAKLKQNSQIIVEYHYLDLASKKSIEQFAKFVSSKFNRLDYLVNNAGLSLISQQKLTQDGFQMVYGVNHLGHFYLTSLLFSLLQKSNYFRIINISSIAHKRVLGFLHKVNIDWENIHFTKQNSYEHNLAYSRSKLCNVLFTKSLAKQIPKQKGMAASLHPGVVRSEITRHQRFLQKIMALVEPALWLFMKSNKQGCQTTLFSILDQSVQSGQYYSDCKISSVNQIASDEQNMQKLWRVSEEDLNIKFNIKF